MAISIPSPQNLGSGDLARCTTHEADQSWPTMIEIVAYWGNGRKGKRRSITIPADQFFGRNTHHAPITGDQIINMIERLRRQA
jgi:hypothetical protein